MNKICLVTGASSGIGKYISYEMIKRDWRVIAIARRSKILNELSNEFGNDKFIPFVCDISNHNQVKKVSSEIKKQFQYISMFFLNAGDGDEEQDKCFDVKYHCRIFNINYFGVVYWINEWLDILKEKDGGIFIATSSIQSYRGMPGATAYGASKSALNYCFESLDTMYFKDNIRFFLIQPGPVDTHMLKTEHPLPFTWHPKKAAKYIVKKVFQGSSKIKFPIFWRLVVKIINIIPYNLYLQMFRLK